MLEELREAATIYMSRYMNTRTHAGSDYNILRMYEAWCFKTRHTRVAGGVLISYTIDNESIKGRFITEMTLMAGTTHHNKHRLSLINMRRHAQPALDHLAAFQVRSCGSMPRAPRGLQGIGCLWGTPGIGCLLGPPGIGCLAARLGLRGIGWLPAC